MPLLKPDTAEIQNNMATYCRVPEYTGTIEGARPERLHNYRRLVFNIVEDTLQSAYPITHTLLTEQEWIDLVNDFFSQHNCQSAQLWQMPYELVEYVENTGYHLKLNKPYLLELLYFEWLEIEVYQMPDAPHAEYTAQGDLLDDAIVVNPDFKLVQLAYPLHKKDHREYEAQKGNYFVLIFRHKTNYSVNFFELSPFLALVFNHLVENKGSLRASLVAVGNANGIHDENILLPNGKAFAEQMIQNTAFLGFAREA